MCDERFCWYCESDFNAFPWANTYSKREKHSKQGTIDVLGNGLDQRYVINAYVQYYPGGPIHISDPYNLRLTCLSNCFSLIRKIPEIESIGIPVGMGCSLAKGSWEDYLSLIEDFAKQIKSEQNAEVILYNYDNKKLSNQESLWK